MAISPREVLKGCIVSYEGRPRIVKGVMDYIILEGTKEWIGAGLMNGEPISTEWLERFGFKQETGNIFGNGKLVISFYGDCFKFIDSPITYQYCHHLQILHFAITGQHLIVPRLPK